MLLPVTPGELRRLILWLAVHYDLQVVEVDEPELEAGNNGWRSLGRIDGAWFEFHFSRHAGGAEILEVLHEQLKRFQKSTKRHNVVKLNSVKRIARN